MKILVISDIPPFVTGGAEMQALRLINAWLADGHEIRCIGRNLPEKIIETNNHTLMLHTISTIQNKGKALRVLSYFFSLSKFLLCNQSWPDIIYTRFLADAAVTISLLKRLKLLDCIVVSTPANAGERGDVYYLSSAPAGKLWVSLVNSQCNAINLIAPQMVADLRSANINRPIISQIPNGIPVHSQPPIETKNEIPYLISVGRLSAQKGYDIFLEALYKLKHTSVPFKAAIIGDGPERVKLHQLITQYGLQSHVKLLGELSQEDINKQLSKADIFVLPSRYEGMANAALEAMEAGRPLILSKCGGLDNYINSSMGWLAELESSESLYTCLVSALATDATTLNKMGIQNQAFVLNNFEITYIAKRYLQLFQSLIGHK